ncbi:hypothetical protein ACHAXT_005613 [Thalassiosira profunda]
MVTAARPFSLLLLSAASRSCGAFVPPAAIAPRRFQPFCVSAASQDTDGSPQPSSTFELRLEALASSGIPPSELPGVLEAVASVCEEYGVPFDASGLQSNDAPSPPESVPGALGRALVVEVDGTPPDFDAEESELIAHLKVESSQRIDEVLHQDGGGGQPILLAFTSHGEAVTVDDAIAKEVSDYGLRDAIDGAMIESIDSPGQTHFDTSSILVFDNLLDDSLLRERLLNVVKGYPEAGSDDDGWNDVENGPNPNRWVRGGLMDVEGDNSDEDDGPCWGLTDEATMDICYNDHPAIAEFESRLTAQLFPDFNVSRLPEAVLGGCVSPLTANAPTHGDAFSYHIDADPMQVPPSPWDDVFGRYPNRSRGKPRFVSCLLYLNSEWDESWGAPTRFLDPPTEETYEVYPKPGRCVIMDQDVSHTVVAPTAAAGKRPRYSLVWKLILHPKKEGQDMKDLSSGRRWPDPVIVGSAKVT